MTRCGLKRSMEWLALGSGGTRKARAHGYQVVDFLEISRNESLEMPIADSSFVTVFARAIKRIDRAKILFYSTLIPIFTSQSETDFLNSSTAAGLTFVCQRYSFLRFFRPASFLRPASVISVP